MSDRSGAADVIVVGLGAMGGSVAYHLAKRGAKVLGFDRYAPPHPQGSSHGDSRILREAYFESPVYTPLARRARELWIELGQAVGGRLFRQTGALMIGPPDGRIVSGALRSAEQHGLATQRFRRRWVATARPRWSSPRGPGCASWFPRYRRWSSGR